MAEIDAKVNMSLDEIIKMENRKKRQKGKFAGFRGARGAAKKGNLRGRGIQGRYNVQKRNIQPWRRQGRVQTGFIKKKSNMFRSRSNMTLNRNLYKNNFKNNFTNNMRRLPSTRNTMVRSRSRSNLTFAQSRFINDNKIANKRTTSMPNLRDPNSVHNRLGYQSPAQLAFTRLKRAKQLLSQNHKSNLHNKMPPLTTLKTLQRNLDLRQQGLIPQRGYTGGLRSDLILRAQRRAQYEEKLMRIKASQMNANQELKYTYPVAQRSMNTWFASLKSQNSGNVNSLKNISRGRSPFRQSRQSKQNMRTQSYSRSRRSRSRSRSRTRQRNTSMRVGELDDRSFSQVMYSLSGGLGVTDKTLNERFSY